jgi:hypothetical protein
MHNHLADKRQVALVLRLTIDGQGQLVHGEVVALAGEAIGRFATWPTLLHVLQTWLANHQENDRLEPSQ